MPYPPAHCATFRFVSIIAGRGQSTFIPHRASATSNQHGCCDASQLWQNGWRHYGQQCWMAEPPSSSSMLLNSTILARRTSEISVFHYWKAAVLVGFFLLLNILYQPTNKHAMMMAESHQGIPTLPVETGQFNVKRNTLFRRMAEIHLNQIQ